MRRLTSVVSRSVAVSRAVAGGSVASPVMVAGRVIAAAALVGALVLCWPAAPAAAHDERDLVVPAGNGKVPEYRNSGATLLVCTGNKAGFDKRIADFPSELRTINLSLWTQCQKSGYRTLQGAVDKVTKSGSTIKVLPGTYLEEPSLDKPIAYCAALPARVGERGYRVLTWDQQVACPNNQNLVAIFDKKNLQIEGTGAKPGDVIVDAQFKRLNGVRVDRSPGIYLRNFTVQHTTRDAVLIMESDGFVADTVVARWNDEHGIIALAVDHGVFTDCEAYGNGEAGLAVSATPDGLERDAVELRRCNSHNNLIGYSGPGGNSVSAHHNSLTYNSVGIATGSEAPGLPGMPQHRATFASNVVANNNEDYYGYVRDGTCARPSADRGYDKGVVCPTRGVPRGTGVLVTGGNDDRWVDNWVYANSYAGFVSLWTPGWTRGDHRVGAQFNSSHDNRYTGNTLGATPDGEAQPNGVDFRWDGQGSGTCWQKPSAGTVPLLLPRCNADAQVSGFGTSRYVAEPMTLVKQYACAGYDLAEQRVPSHCDWFGASGLDRAEVRYGLAEAVVLGFVLFVLWWRLLRGRGAQVAVLGLVLSLAGLGVCAYASWHETTRWPAVGLGLLGLGLLAYAAPMRRRGRSGLAGFTIAMAIFALLGALDRGLWLVPFLPVPPSLLRTLVEVIWVPWALIASVAGRVVARTSVRADPLVRFAATLRG